MKYRKVLLSDEWSSDQLSAVSQTYKIIITENVRFIIERYSFSSDYPWIDTKYNIPGRYDYPDSDIIKGKSLIYSWIQGRGLEAISEILKHRKSLNLPLSDNEIRKAQALLKMLFDKMYELYKRNNGHFPFIMSVAGEPLRMPDKIVTEHQIHFEPFTISKDTKYTISDIFCYKGILSAALYLGESKIANELSTACEEIYSSAFDDGIDNDQIFFDIANPAIPQAGKISHAPFMLIIGMLTVLSDCLAIDKISAMGIRVINYVIERYVNRNGKWAGLKDYDFVEAIDSDGNPYKEDGKILSDPGHALEFVGLSMKLLNILNDNPNCNENSRKQYRKLADILSNILIRNFENGFVKELGGICKSVDLISREIINPEMPWWSLPETIRSAIFLYNSYANDCNLTRRIINPDKSKDTSPIAADESTACRYSSTPEPMNFDKSDDIKNIVSETPIDDKNIKIFSKIFSACHNAFIEHYIVEDCHLLAIQSRNGTGNISNAIPAIPDIDPCYHTCLSLADCTAIIDNLIAKR